MAFIVDGHGKRVNVDIDMRFISEKAVIFDDNAILRDVYILNLYEGKTFTNNKEPELIKQVEIWDKEPTKEKIMYEMSQAGLSRYGIATIEHGYMLDFAEED